MLCLYRNAIFHGRRHGRHAGHGRHGRHARAKGGVGAQQNLAVSSLSVATRRAWSGRCRYRLLRARSVAIALLWCDCGAAWRGAAFCGAFGAQRGLCLVVVACWCRACGRPAPPPLPPRRCICVTIWCAFYDAHAGGAAVSGAVAFVRPSLVGPLCVGTCGWLVVSVRVPLPLCTRASSRSIVLLCFLRRNVAAPVPLAGVSSGECGRRRVTRTR